MSQHTPGPWKVIDAKGGKDRLQVRRDGEISETFSLMIAHVYDFDDRKHNQNSEGISFEAEANARLIAACPDMASYVISKALDGDADAEKIARSFGWTPA